MSSRISAPAIRGRADDFGAGMHGHAPLDLSAANDLLSSPWPDAPKVGRVAVWPQRRRYGVARLGPGAPRALRRALCIDAFGDANASHV